MMKKVKPKKYKFTFGKFKGKTVKEILIDESASALLNYVQWCMDNVEWFNEPKLVKYLEKKYWKEEMAGTHQDFRDWCGGGWESQMPDHGV